MLAEYYASMKGLETTVKEAIAQLNTGGAGPGGVDQVFGGDVNAWKAVANRPTLPDARRQYQSVHCAT